MFSSNLKLSSANYLSLEESKICRLGKGLAVWTDPIVSKKLMNINKESKC